MSPSTYTLLATLTASLLLAPSGALLADTPSKPTIDRSVVVYFGDLDLARPRDVARLYRRLETAADQTCGEKEISGTHGALPQYRKCYANAVSKAVADLDRPAVTAYHQRHRIFERDSVTTLAQR
jgi:UrcA family protein